MPHRLLLAALVVATVFPSTAAAAVCGAGTGAWQAAAASGSADRALPASTRMRVEVRTKRTGGEQRVVALRTNRLAVTRGARRVALRTASGRTLVATRVAGRGWRTVEVTLDAVADRVGLRVDGGRRASARARVAPERSVRLGGTGGRVTAAKVAFVPDCGAAVLDCPPDLDGRAGVRWVSRDRLPLIGAVPLLAEGQDSSHRGRSARMDQPRFVARQPGLFVLSALGSRGITTAALGAQVLAALLTGGPSPIEADLLDAVDPARFWVRDRRRSPVG